MAEEDEGSRLVIDVDPVEAVSFSYEDDRIPISYQKIGKNACEHPEEVVHMLLDMMFTPR